MLSLLCFIPLALAADALPGRDAALADATKAAKYYIAHSKTGFAPDCGWERAPFMLGLAQLAKANGDKWADEWPADVLFSWADHFDWQLCGLKDGRTVDGNNQLCGATYAELYALDGTKNKTMLAGTLAEFDAEINEGDTSLWSWVDALFMAMNTWSRIGSVTGDQKYFDQQFKLFSAAALEGPSGNTPPGRPPAPGVKATYHFWSDENDLFYRDDRYLNSSIFWGRGNGWAIGALVAALEYTPAADPHKVVYTGLLKKQAAKLKSIQSPDGCWRASLLNASGYPSPETTGSASFTYGIAYGINEGILNKADYLPVLENAWGCLANKALQPSGLFGYCQPVGGSPEHNIDPDSTSDFCVGLFVLAATQVAQVAA